MKLADRFTARGHPSIRSTHETTLMVTRDMDLTLRGDCIVAIEAEKGLKDLDPPLKELIRNTETSVSILIEAGGSSFRVSGKGDPRLPLSHPSEMVIRKSGYVCDRTLMVRADKAAKEVPREFVDLLKDHERVIKVTISAELVTQKR